MILPVPVADLSTGADAFPAWPNCCCTGAGIDCVSSDADDMERVNRFVELDDDDEGDRTGPKASSAPAPSVPDRFCEWVEEEVRVESRMEPDRGGKVVPPPEAAVVPPLDRVPVTVEEKRASPLGGTPLGKEE